MALQQSHYEINVSLNGRHLFATDARSAVNESEMLYLYRVLKAKFPESEGYEILVCFNECVGQYITPKF